MRSNEIHRKEVEKNVMKLRILGSKYIKFAIDIFLDILAAFLKQSIFFS